MSKSNTHTRGPMCVCSAYSTAAVALKATEALANVYSLVTNSVFELTKCNNTADVAPSQEVCLFFFNEGDTIESRCLQVSPPLCSSGLFLLYVQSALRYLRYGLCYTRWW